MDKLRGKGSERGPNGKDIKVIKVIVVRDGGRKGSEINRKNIEEVVDRKLELLKKLREEASVLIEKGAGAGPETKEIMRKLLFDFGLFPDYLIRDRKGMLNQLPPFDPNLLRSFIDCIIEVTKKVKELSSYSKFKTEGIKIVRSIGEERKKEGISNEDAGIEIITAFLSVVSAIDNEMKKSRE